MMPMSDSWSPWRLARIGVALLLLILLTACAVPAKKVALAQTYVSQAQAAPVRCTRADNCALPSVLTAAAHAAIASSTPDRPRHHVTLLDRAEDALVARLHLIAAARESIDIQTYIWSDDDAGRLMLDALKQAALRGVNVRIVADQLFAFSNIEQLARLARTSPNLSIRLYNPTFHKAHTSVLEFGAGIVCCFKRFNQRMHNKLLLVDDIIGITGGRNYENRYFGWDKAFNYRDRDIIVGGPVAHKMAQTFDQFWEHQRSLDLIELRDVNRQILRDGAHAPGWQTPEYDAPARIQRVQYRARNNAWIERHLLAHAFDVGKVDYFSDYPGKTNNPEKVEARAYTRHIMHLIAAAQNRIIIQTPYLVLSRRARHILRDLQQQDKPPRVMVSTNSLATTDAFVSYAVSHKYKKRYLTKYGFEIYELKPHPANAALSIAPPVRRQVRTKQDTDDERHRVDSFHQHRGPRARPAPLMADNIRIGLHAKSIVVDDDIAMVGTHNFDPRSDHYNTESGVIVYDKTFTNALRIQILRDMQTDMAWTIAPRPNSIPILSDISRGIGSISSYLPWFDLWPFRYATSFELKPGCRPMAPSDPNFYDCYVPVGDFPGVDLSLKGIYTRLATGFAFGVSGIL